MPLQDDSPLRRLTASRSWLATRFSRLAGIDPEVLRYGDPGSVWGRWFVWLVVVVEMAYRPETWYPHNSSFLLVHVPLVLFNGFLHYWPLSKLPVTWHWLVALSAMDIALITAGLVMAGEFRTIHYLGYYPALALVAVILSSFMFILAWTTMAAALYTVVSLTQGSGLDIEDRPFAKSTLQVFRAQLILHDKVQAVFESSLRLARQSGYLKKRGMRAALDTTFILGRGVVKDTCNLLSHGIVKLLRGLAAVEQTRVREWAEARGCERQLGSSIKGEPAIDWSDKRARAALLAAIVADADRLLELSRQAQGTLPEGSDERQEILAAAELLGQLLLQDVERKSCDSGMSLKDGVSKDRMMSVHDPEMRHGHKSSSRRFDGHKAAIVVDTDSELITAVEVLPGNAPDNLRVLELVERSEANTGMPVEESLGDAAYGDGDTRRAFADAGRTLIARVPGRPDRRHFPKEDFRIDLESGTCTCPAGKVARSIRPSGTRTDPTGRIHQLKGSGSMEQSAGYARYGLGAWPGRRVWDERCNCTRRACPRP